jgi:Zn-dependent peptidase ImmA (M78 family)
MRDLTREKDPRVFLPKLIAQCAACGVAVVVLRPPTGCKASGATRFLSSARPFLIFSFRHVSDDHFWFTFFHEGGHLVLHSDKIIFLEGDDKLSNQEESEANEFSATLLVPPEYRDEMFALPVDGRAVIRFARKLGVSSGIIVGQLQHHGKLRRNQLNNLKRSYEWSDD